jgi:hypothetical protein
MSFNQLLAVSVLNNLWAWAALVAAVILVGALVSKVKRRPGNRMPQGYTGLEDNPAPFGDDADDHEPDQSRAVSANPQNWPNRSTVNNSTVNNSDGDQPEKTYDYTAKDFSKPPKPHYPPM